MADILKEAKDAFDLIAEHETDNRRSYEDNIDFALLENQWPEKVRQDRELEGRPCLTINRLPTFGRQVVNDARQNKPGITVHPVDDSADPETAEILNGLIRNIEQSSNAEVAYDTALECAVFGGFGYFRINTAYTSDDTFDQDLVIERIANPLSVFADCYSTAADSSDWNDAFVVDTLTKAQFQAKYKGADQVDWSAEEWLDVKSPWLDGDMVMVAEYWRRREVARKVLLLSDGSIIPEEQFKANAELFQALGVTVQAQREVRSHKVTQHILSGAEELEKVDWAGKYIPIVPVYGVEINLKGKRTFRSLIQSAIDAQRRYNYHQTTVTELLALAPKAPWIGPVGSFETDAAKWATANVQSHPHIEYDNKGVPPQRLPFAGVPVGELQAALTASDDMKAVLGLFDASLGKQGNETSGVAIAARQREGDVSTFHFIDNLARGIRHAGRILIDLIPHVYSVPRVLRVLGPDGAPKMATVNQPTTVEQEGPDGQVQEVQKIYDLTAGKYDLVVKAGPSFATQREAFVAAATEIMRAVPQFAPALAPELIESFDLPNSKEVKERFDRLSGDIPDPRLEQAKEIVGQMQQGLQKAGQENQALQQQLQQLQADNQALAQDAINKARELEIKAYEAETKRIQAEKPTQVRAANG